MGTISYPFQFNTRYRTDGAVVHSVEAKLNNYMLINYPKFNYRVENDLLDSAPVDTNCANRSLEVLAKKG